MKKLLPDGISDFKTLIENDYYYVDKTPFISDVGKNVGKTLLFTRPRRFGKTLNMSTVSYTHLTLPTIDISCRSRWSPYH